MKKIFLIALTLFILNSIHANFFSSAFDHVKHAVEGAVGQVSGAGTNDQAIKQLESVIAQYQNALQQEQAALQQEQNALQQEQGAIHQEQGVIQQEAQVIKNDQNLLNQCNIKNAVYLHLLPHAPPVTPADIYALLVEITLINLFDPLISSDDYASLHNAFDANDLVSFAKTLAPLTDDQLAKIVMQYNLPNGTAQCDVRQLANGFITGINNMKPGDANQAYLTKSAMSAQGFKSWCWNLNTNWWHGDSGCSQDLCTGVYNAILPQINTRMCNTNKLGQAFLQAWKNLKPGAPDESYIRKSATSIDGFKAWAWNLNTDYWHGDSGCSQDLAAQTYNQIKNQLK